jgi:hypothetical protein
MKSRGLPDLIEGSRVTLGSNWRWYSTRFRLGLLWEKSAPGAAPLLSLNWLLIRARGRLRKQHHANEEETRYEEVEHLNGKGQETSI